MPIQKRIVCLANSRKPGGRCVAGKECSGSAWIRPVSERPGEEVSDGERQYFNGDDPKLLDVMDIFLQRAVPDQYQPENWILDSDYCWIRAAQLTYGDLPGLADQPPALWSRGSSSRGGISDRITPAEAVASSGSLYLISVDSMQLIVSRERSEQGYRARVRGHFSYRGTQYRLVVTDPEIERTYKPGPEGEFPLGACYATVSLAKPWGGYSYKLIAAIFTPAPVAGPTA